MSGPVTNLRPSLLSETHTVLIGGEFDVRTGGQRALQRPVLNDDLSVFLTFIMLACFSFSLLLLLSIALI